MSSPPYSSTKSDNDPLLSKVDNVTYNPNVKINIPTTSYQNPENQFVSASLHAYSSTSVQPKPLNQQLENTKGALKEVKDIMRGNIEKALERDVNINELAEKSDELAEGAQRFQKKANAVKKHMWWENCKSSTALWIIIAIVIAFIILIIIIATSTHKKHN